MLSTTDLDAGWQLTLQDGGTVPATVPGCVHTDLMAAGLLDDPYLDRNEDTQHWIGNSDWRYAADVDIATHGHDRVDLIFDGLDTVAEISLAGQNVGSTRNMHRRYRFDVTALASDQPRPLVVDFRSPRRYAEQVRADVGDRPGAYDEPIQYIRKMACNFGWDWGPTLTTAGIWRRVSVERWSVARLAQVRPEVTVVGSDGLVVVKVEVERAADVALTVSARVRGVEASATIPSGETSAAVALEVPDVEMWWPHDLGDQPLQTLDVALADDGGDALDTWSRRVGFRSIELRTAPDADGSPFVIVVNGVEVFVRGANWIPEDCFPSRVDRDRYAARIKQGIGANLNLLRVWGGGIYESDDFYDVCDELGVLVWQDFLFACAAYPEEEPLRSEVEGEARDNVVRLMPHPSLVLWNGNNENIWGFHDWGWQEKLEGRTWGWGYYAELLPSVVAELDPTRPYWPGSPYSGTPDIHPNDQAHGPMHIWTVWNDLDYTAYATYGPRFVAEFGFQGPPSWATLTRAIHDDPLLPGSPGVLAHQKAEDGNGKLARGMAPHLPEPHTTDDWHYLTQVNQANAVAFGLEHFRSLRPRCMGAIVWQLNDCWPVTSWAAVDGDGRRKPLWYSMRRAFAPLLLTIQPRSDAPVVVLVNDGTTQWSGELEVTRRTLDGMVVAKSSVLVDVDARTSHTVPLPVEVTAPDDAHGEVLVAEVGEVRALWFFAEDRDLALDRGAAEVTVVDAADGVELRIAASSLVRHLVVQADRVDPDAEVDDQLVTVLPGEVHTVRIRTSVPADDPRWTSAPVLRCLNDLAQGG